MSTSSSSIEPAVIFRPELDKLTTGTTRRYYGRRTLTDYGDHIEWTDGRKIWKWRLPDQTHGLVDYPVLTAILQVPSKNLLGAHVGVNRVAFIAKDGHILAQLSQRLLPTTLLDSILPPEAYRQLEARGVTRTQEHYNSLRDLYAAHPDPSLNRVTLSFACHPRTWVFGMVILVVITTNIALLAAGYYA